METSPNQAYLVLFESRLVEPYDGLLTVPFKPADKMPPFIKQISIWID